MILSVLQTLMSNLAHVLLCAEHMLRRLCSWGFDLKLKPQTQREPHPSIRVPKDRWLRLFGEATLASLLPTTQLKKVILLDLIRQQHTEICLLISQESAQSIPDLSCNRKLLAVCLVLEPNASEHLESGSLHFRTRVNV